MSQTVVITGATGGVGRATARLFAKRGASVAILARGEEGLSATKAEIADLGGRAIAVQGDVADADAVEQLAWRTEAELGAIDVWVNNARCTCPASTPLSSGGVGRTCRRSQDRCCRFCNPKPPRTP